MDSPKFESDRRYIVLYNGMSPYGLVIAIPLSVYFIVQSWGFLLFVLIWFLMFFCPNRPIALIAHGDDSVLRVPCLWGEGREWRCSDIDHLSYEYSPLRRRGCAKVKLVLKDQTAHFLPGSTGRLLRTRPQLPTQPAGQQPRIAVVRTKVFLQRIHEFTGVPLDTSSALWWT